MALRRKMIQAANYGGQDTRYVIYTTYSGKPQFLGPWRPYRQPPALHKEPFRAKYYRYKKNALDQLGTAERFFDDCGVAKVLMNQSCVFHYEVK